MKVEKAGKAGIGAAKVAGKAGIITTKKTLGAISNIYNTYSGNKGMNAAAWSRMSFYSTLGAGAGIGLGVIFPPALVVTATAAPLAAIFAYAAHRTSETPDKVHHPFRHRSSHL